MALNTQPYKGTRDFYPEDMRLRNWMFGVMREEVAKFGYQEYDGPILEPLDLYRSKTSDEIVNEQVYNFVDRGSREIAIRPEMTPTVSRMVAGRRQELGYPLRLFSIPNVWRYERPQKGRLREHWQLNVDIFGDANLSADHEIILLSDSIMKAFGSMPEMYEIRINSRRHLGSVLTSLGVGSEGLVDIIRLIDKKDKMSQEDFKKILLELMPVDKVDSLLEHLDAKENVPKNIQRLLEDLKDSGVESACYAPALARGFDYYTDVVFEVFDKNPDNNRSIFGGGRYDGLVGLFGVEPVPTVGFGLGDVTLEDFLRTHDLIPSLRSDIDMVAIMVGDTYKQAQSLLKGLRSKGINVSVDATDRKLDKKIKSAVKQGVKRALFIGKKELQSQKFLLRDLEKGEEITLSIDEMINLLNSFKKS